MKKSSAIKSVILAALSIVFLSSCESEWIDRKTNSVNGAYYYDTYSELMDFYEIYKIKNIEDFLLIDLDDTDYDVTYEFHYYGVPSEVKDNQIRDYDFPSSAFHYVINENTLYIYEINYIDTSNELTYENIYRSPTITIYYFFGDSYFAYLEFEDDIDEELLNLIHERFMIAVDNI